MGGNIHHGMNHINNSNRSNKSDGLQGDIQSSSLLNLTSKQDIVEGCGKTRNKGNPLFDDKDLILQMLIKFIVDLKKYTLPLVKKRVTQRQVENPF